MTRDAQDRSRRGVYLPDDCWGWLEATADRDGSAISDLLEGLVLLAQDAAQAKADALIEAKARVIRLRATVNETRVRGNGEERVLERALRNAEAEVRRLSGVRS